MYSCTVYIIPCTAVQCAYYNVQLLQCTKLQGFINRCGAELWTCYGQNGKELSQVENITFR